MKEPAQATNKSLSLTRSFIHKVKLPMVLSKRSLIHPARSCLTWQAGQTASKKNLIIPEAPLKSICFKGLNYCKNQILRRRSISVVKVFRTSPAFPRMI